MSKDEGDDLAFDEMEINGYGEAEMTFLCQVQRLQVCLRGGNTVDEALGDIPEVEREVFGDEKSLIVRWSVVETTWNGMVWEDVGIVFIASIVECGSDLNLEGEDASDYLNE